MIFIETNQRTRELRNDNLKKQEATRKVTRTHYMTRTQEEEQPQMSIELKTLRLRTRCVTATLTSYAK